MSLPRIIRRYFSAQSVLLPQPPTTPVAFTPQAVHARLQELHQNDPPSAQPVQTRPRTTIMNILLMNLRRTPYGHFVSKSNVFVGPRGIGKSTVFRQVQSVSQDLDPNLRVAYADLSCANDLEHVLPSTILGQIADREKISYNPNGYNRVEPILEALYKNNIRVALLYDETEILYHEETKTRQKFIKDLLVLGNTTLRNVHTLLGGSSAALPLLISNTAKHDPIISTDYKLHAIDLNDTKFSTIRVSASPHVQDMENIIQLYIPHLEPEYRMRLAAILTFWVGVSLRRACMILEDLQTQPDNIIEVLKYHLLNNNPVILHDSRENHTYREFRGIIDCLLNNLVQENKSIISSLPNPDHPDQLLDAIAKHDWDRELRPVVPWLLKTDDLGTEAVMGSIIKLVDKGWFLQNYEEIYPISIAQLYYYNLWLEKGQKGNIRQYMGQILDKLQVGLVEAIKVAIQIKLYGGE